MTRHRFFFAVLLFLVAHPASAQITSLADLYKLDDFGTSPTIQAERNHITIDGGFSGKHLILRAKIADGWHLYSVTQPEGGTLPTRFTLEAPTLEFDSVPETIVPTTPPRVVTDVPGFEVDIEEHDQSVTWLLTFKNDLPHDAILRGQLEGQVCQAGEGGACVPITVPFEIAFDGKLDVKIHRDAAAQIPKRFVYDEPGSVSAELTFAPREMSQVTGFGMVLLYAFFGGLVLNVMPCVLPVIGLKILSFFEQAGKSRARAFYLNACYSLGLLSVFLFLAAMSYGLSRLFSFDLFSIIMACIVFMMALSLMDVWELSLPSFVNTLIGSGTSQKLTQQEGAVGAFFKGVITTLLAIPCGAPLLSPAVNWADMQIRSGNTGWVFVAYGMIGLGMASPYLLIGAFPELLRFLPRPGAWMETFKNVMGYLLLVAVVWILYFIQLERLLPTVALLFALWFACWMVGRLDYATQTRTRIQVWIVSLFVVTTTALFSFNIGIGNPHTLENAMLDKLARLAQLANPDVDASHGGIQQHWTLYTPERFTTALESGKPVMVDFTADWCMNCKALELAVLETQPILEKMDEKGVVSFMADRTKEGDASKFLKQLGADMVPTLAIFDPKKPNEPVILRGGYTRSTLLELLDKLEVESP